jgi:hypothetical protein
LITIWQKIETNLTDSATILAWTRDRFYDSNLAFITSQVAHIKENDRALEYKYSTWLPVESLVFLDLTQTRIHKFSSNLLNNWVNERQPKVTRNKIVIKLTLAVACVSLR